MRIRMQQGSSPAGLSFSRWDLAIVGQKVDRRGDAAVKFASVHAQEVLEVCYDSQSLSLTANGDDIDCDDLMRRLASDSQQTVLLEATTLGFVELALCCRAAISCNLGVSILYIEPREYFTPRAFEVVHRRDFNLSDEVSGFSAIPGAAFVLTESVLQKAIFLVGYEGQRLDQAFEQLPLVPRNCSVVFGVPAFNPGWEMNSFANNVRVMRERGVTGDVSFCGADNPSAVFELLSARHRELVRDEKLFIFPIGTKPHGIGAALFSAAFPDVGVTYDNPKRRINRSQDIGAWHMYSVATSDSHNNPSDL